MNDNSVSFRQKWNESADFFLNRGLARAAYTYSPDDIKPCLHPLVTPKGHVLTGTMMSDHVWHRALWFTIKLINGTNYWEERENYGIQQSASEPKIELLSKESTQITHELKWTADQTGVVFNEKRSLSISCDGEGVTHVLWDATLQATQALTLDRTPYTTWGGYGGMSFRANREMHDVRFVVPGGAAVEGFVGQFHDWVILEGRMDGGEDERVSIGLIDHPDNPRSPSPWYGRSVNGLTFLNAAFLFHEPLAVAEGEELRFRYNIVYRDGLWQPSEFQAIADKFRQSSANT